MAWALLWWRKLSWRLRNSSTFQCQRRKSFGRLQRIWRVLGNYLLWVKIKSLIGMICSTWQPFLPNPECPTCFHNSLFLSGSIFVYILSHFFMCMYLYMDFLFYSDIIIQIIQLWDHSFCEILELWFLLIIIGMVLILFICRKGVLFMWYIVVQWGYWFAKV